MHSHTAMCGFKKLSTESVGSHRELVANSRSHRRRDATRQLRRVGVVNAPVGSRDPVYNFLCCLAIEVGDK